MTKGYLSFGLLRPVMIRDYRMKGANDFILLDNEGYIGTTAAANCVTRLVVVIALRAVHVGYLISRYRVKKFWFL